MAIVDKNTLFIKMIVLINFWLLCVIQINFLIFGSIILLDYTFLFRKAVLFIEDLEKLFKLVIKIENKLNDKDNFNDEETLLLKIINSECNYIVLLNDYVRLQKSKN